MHNLFQLAGARSVDQQASNSVPNQNAQSVIEDGHYTSALNNLYQPNPPVCMPPLLNPVPPMLQSNPSAMFDSLVNNQHMGNAVGMAGHPAAEAPKTLNNQVC